MPKKKSKKPTSKQSNLINATFIKGVGVGLVLTLLAYLLYLRFTFEPLPPTNIPPDTISDDLKRSCESHCSNSNSFNNFFCYVYCINAGNPWE